MYYKCNTVHEINVKTNLHFLADLLPSCIHSVHPPTLSAEGGGGVEPHQIFKKGELNRVSIFRGIAGKEGVTFSGGCSFYIKNKRKSEIFNNKKSL